MIRTALRLLGLSLMVLSGSALAEDAYPDGASRTFSDWTVTCDNAHTCWAESFAGQYGAGALTLRRDAAADAKLTIVLSRGDEGTLDTMAFDEPGFEAAFKDATLRMYDADYGPRFTIADSQTDLFLKALRKATKLSDPSGDGFEISLAGASAALRFIDELQGRAGTATALVATGDKPASAVPAAPAFPIIKAPPMSVSLIEAKPGPELLAASEADCTEDPENRSSGFDPEGFRLEDGREIWLMPCLNGAYNYVSTAYLKTGDTIAALPFTGPQEGGPSPKDLAQLWNPTLNAEEKSTPLTLSTFGKNRGMGDCGTISVHVWTGESFALVKYMEMADCSGLWEDEWPVRWQAVVETK